MLKRRCPYCERLIHGMNQSILNFNLSSHVEKHERHGDPRNEMFLKGALRTALSWSATAFAAMGFLDNDWLVRVVNTRTGLEAATVAIAILGVLKVVLTLRAPQKLDMYHSGVRQGMDWLFSYVIGGIGRAWFTLYQALIPFYPNPGVIIVLGLYFILVLDVVAMKQVFLGKSRWSFGRLLWSS